MNKELLLAACIAALMLAGCATNVNVDNASKSDAEMIMADKTTQASNALRDYVSIVNENRARVGVRQANITTDALDINFIGKPQELLQAIAVRYGYQYSEIGQWLDIKPINIYVTKTSPTDILRNIGYQIDSQGDVVLDMESKVIRLNYKPLLAPINRSK